MKFRDEIVWQIRTFAEVERKGYMLSLWVAGRALHIWRPGRPFGLHVSAPGGRYWKVLK